MEEAPGRGGGRALKIAFWGTPDFAVPSLRALDDQGFDVVGVITQPDRPAGRGRRLQASAVKETALDLGLAVLMPERPRGDAFLEDFGALGADLSVVVAYGHILKPEVMAASPGGFINVHASLLPELRGAAPINWAIARGHDRTGVTVMRMVEAMDAGPMLLQVEEPILPDETASELWLRLSEVGAVALVEALTLMAAGAVQEVEQDHDRATFAPKVNRQVARIDWARPAREIEWHVRGMDAVPGAWSELDGAPVKLFRPTVAEAVAEAVAGAEEGTEEGARPGTVLVADPEQGVVVAAGSGAVAFAEVQPPGRRRMEARAWIAGRGVVAGQRFG